MIQVTKPFFPPLEEYSEYLKGAWDREWITNNGPLVNRLEEELISYLGIDNLLFTGNGTIALQIAIKALELKGEIITTPFTYVATASSIFWEGCTPVFVDIDNSTFNIDSDKIESAITDQTSAILATHVFGNPCEVERIGEIARRNNLKVIYDAAHCFGTTFKGKSIFNWGDISTASFHATKIYHTVEGGAVISSNSNLFQRMRYMRNFGHDGPYKFNGVGINGKNSELHAAMGLTNLKYIDEILHKREQQFLFYKECLEGLELEFQKPESEAEINHSYFPIVLSNEEVTGKLELELAENEIFARRYFYPSLNTLDYLSGEVPISEDIAARILCLPLYHDLKNSEQAKICDIISGCIE
ncbi:MAG: DegT/DnrJ/EryC1/StrS family aminotransferase [Balneola sp.]|nr:MAG: DegT/DnrJ/EryC1/StrS family aminotransferase [Balneola sp.]